MTCLRRVFSVGSRVSELVCDLQDRIQDKPSIQKKRVDSSRKQHVYIYSPYQINYFKSQ